MWHRAWRWKVFSHVFDKLFLIKAARDTFTASIGRWSQYGLDSFSFIYIWCCCFVIFRLMVDSRWHQRKLSTTLAAVGWSQWWCDGCHRDQRDIFSKDLWCIPYLVVVFNSELILFLVSLVVEYQMLDWEEIPCFVLVYCLLCSVDFMGFSTISIKFWISMIKISPISVSWVSSQIWRIWESIGNVYTLVGTVMINTFSWASNSIILSVFFSMA